MDTLSEVVIQGWWVGRKVGRMGKVSQTQTHLLSSSFLSLSLALPSLPSSIWVNEGAFAQSMRILLCAVIQPVKVQGQH